MSLDFWGLVTEEYLHKLIFMIVSPTIPLSGHQEEYYMITKKLGFLLMPVFFAHGNPI